MSLNQRITTEFSPCTPSAPQFRDLSIQTFRGNEIGFDPRCIVGVTQNEGFAFTQGRYFNLRHYPLIGFLEAAGFSLEEI